MWLTVEGDMIFYDIKHKAGKWLSQKYVFSGFITDLRKMTSIPSTIEQKRMEKWRKQNQSGKPCAFLGRTNALGALIKI